MPLRIKSLSAILSIVGLIAIQGVFLPVILRVTLFIVMLCREASKGSLGVPKKILEVNINLVPTLPPSVARRCRQTTFLQSVVATISRRKNAFS